MQKSNIINEFKGVYEIFSNFYPVTIHFDGMSFPTVEHAYVAAKTRDRMFRYEISQLSALAAGKAKRLGRTIKLVENWDIMKLDIMKMFLKQKFKYRELRDFIIETEDAILIEGNYWHDNYWGDCYCKRCSSIVGQNNLGKLLMKVRETLQ